MVTSILLIYCVSSRTPSHLTHTSKLTFKKRFYHAACNPAVFSVLDSYDRPCGSNDNLLQHARWYESDWNIKKSKILSLSFEGVVFITWRDTIF